MRNFFWATVAVGLNLVVAEVTVLKLTQTIYDRAPKLRIKGTGFDVDASAISLGFSSGGGSTLIPGKDFTIMKDDDGLILKIFANRRWAVLDGKTPPVFLMLNTITFAADPTKNLLSEPILVANVIPTPTVNANPNIIYATATNELRINGTGFVGMKKVDLFFSPPLFKEVSYEVVSRFPLERDEIVLRIRHNYAWRDEPGSLSVVGIDTGGGPVKLNGVEGIRVAEVVANLEQHGVTIEASPETFIYNDETNLLITGTGLNPKGNVLRFSNNLLGKGVNYTTVATTETSIALRIATGSLWRRNVENLPGVLTLLAVNAGEGLVAVGPTNSGKGRDVATVFERPVIHSSNKKLFRSQSHELHIFGEGFPKVLGKTQLRFSPPLTEDVDYTIKTISRTELEVTLVDMKEWRSDDGPLQITEVNTRGDEAGWVKVGGAGGVHVAEVVGNVESDATGGIEVYPINAKVYQSVLQKSIDIIGKGFKTGIAFTFEPDLKENVDYKLEFGSPNKMTLKLMDGKKWSPAAGLIIAKSVNVGAKSYQLAGTDGVRVATVYTDPTIVTGKENFHETQSKVIAIAGTGFTNTQDMKVTLSPTMPVAYKILNVLEDTIRIQLKPTHDWLPSFMNLKEGGADKKVPLSIVSIDTGAGDVSFPDPVVIGIVVQDREGVTCDDSCEFAFDGTCDDGSEGDYEEYYEQYGYYRDDDLGGYAGGDGTEGERAAAGGTYEEGYGAESDDYYMADDGYKVAPCVQGTDCTDCGGVDKIVDYSKVPEPGSGIEVCSNTCVYARDGICDDPRGVNYCQIGTDCADCGPVGADNFTRADDDGWWDDDDDYWTFNDGSFLDQTKGLNENRDRVKVFKKPDNSGPGWMFLVVLEGMVYTVGAIFAAAALYLGMRWYKGQSVPFMNAFNPDSQMHQQDLAMMPTRRMPITPDVIRT